MSQNGNNISTPVASGNVGPPIASGNAEERLMVCIIHERNFLPLYNQSF